MAEFEWMLLEYAEGVGPELSTAQSLINDSAATEGKNEQLQSLIAN